VPLSSSIIHFSLIAIVISPTPSYIVCSYFEVYSVADYFAVRCRGYTFAPELKTPQSLCGLRLCQTLYTELAMSLHDKWDAVQVNETVGREVNLPDSTQNESWLSAASDANFAVAAI
jgi:hypothetical protein